MRAWRWLRAEAEAAVAVAAERRSADQRRDAMRCHQQPHDRSNAPPIPPHGRTVDRDAPPSQAHPRRAMARRAGQGSAIERIIGSAPSASTFAGWPQRRPLHAHPSVDTHTPCRESCDAMRWDAMRNGAAYGLCRSPIANWTMSGGNSFGPFWAQRPDTERAAHSADGSTR